MTIVKIFMNNSFVVGRRVRDEKEMLLWDRDEYPNPIASLMLWAKSEGHTLANVDENGIHPQVIG